MSFTSLQFAIFLPVVTALFFIVPPRFKLWVMLLASWYFYMSWQPIFILVLLYSTLASYAVAYPIAATGGRVRQTWLWIGVALTLAPLILYKYFNFLNAQLGDLLGRTMPSGAPGALDLSFTLPIGISFFTFQALSYIIDVYRKDVMVEPSFSIYALYKAFFPQLVAGPIERATHLLPQIAKLGREASSTQFQFDAARTSAGLRLILWGLFKKLVIADNLAVLVDELFSGHASYNGAQLLIGSYFFAYQIYCDFSGYTDIARGCARIFGFELMENFRAPYCSRSIREFWQRWHISLSTWFRDYVYRPLGGNRTSEQRWALNIMVTFLLSGMWHGANWTFLIWGALHGFYYMVGRATERPRRYLASLLLYDRLPDFVRGFVQVFIIFHLVVLAWVFFRAPDLTSAVSILRKIAHDVPPMLMQLAADTLALRVDTTATYWAQLMHLELASFLLLWNPGTKLVVAAIVVLEVVDYLRERPLVARTFLAVPWPMRWLAYYAVVGAVLVLAPFGSKQFIYFQF